MRVQFVCRVGTPEGKILESLFEAQDERALRRDLEGRGYHVFEVRRPGLLAGLRLPGLGGARRRVQAGELLVFNQELAALLRSGLPLLQSLDLLVGRQRDRGFKEVLTEVRERVRGGESFSAAVAGFGDLFPALYAPTLQAGERSGELEQVIRRFVRYQRLVREARKKIVSALVYPSVLIGLSAALIAVVTTYVLPKFRDFFGGLGADLPLLTRAVMAISGFAQANGWLLLLSAVLGSLLGSQWVRTRSGRLALDRWRVALPLAGPIALDLSLSEFCRSLSILLAGGIPILAALDSAVGAVANTWVRARLAAVPGEVRQGRAVADALQETGIASSLLVDMVKVGETTGSLDGMLSDVSDFLDEEVETRMGRLLSLLEPLMLITMGLLVTLLLVAVYLPLYGLLGNIPT
ncbi:MAG: type II secretion system F family protein [Thermoanaerobaculia bacterium]